jgi:hypothetical protein
MAEVHTNDLTVIYLTCNKHPKGFAEFQRKTLVDAMGEAKLISVSREPLDFGKNILDTGKESHINMYYQLMEAAKVADTPYIAVAEDDVLYSKEHFTTFRPPEDGFAYNMSRWSLYTWKPIYSIKQRISNCTLIAPRKKLIEAWEERFKKYPGDSMPSYFVCELTRNSYERQLVVTEHKRYEFFSEVPVIHLNHDVGKDGLGRRKGLGQIKAYDIPVWGKAEELIKRYA